MNEEKRLYITKIWAVIFFAYYLVLFCAGSVISFLILLNLEKQNDNLLEIAYFGSIAIAITGSSIAYIRKLYKICFNYSIDYNDDDPILFKRLGTFFYLFTRPLFSIAFSFLTVASLRVAILVSSSSNDVLDIGFVYISMITSFYVGFLSGAFLKKLEDKGQGKLDELP